MNGALGATRKCLTCTGYQECIIGNFWTCKHCDAVRKQAVDFGSGPNPRIDYRRTVWAPRYMNRPPVTGFVAWPTLNDIPREFTGILYTPVCVYMPKNHEGTVYDNDGRRYNACDWCPVP